MREAVGWEAGPYDAPALERLDVVVTARVDGQLVGHASALTDGVWHAFLVDVLVHPEHRRRGVGRRLVAETVAAAREAGARIVHVDFAEEHREFYAGCGFRIGLAGILELS